MSDANKIRQLIADRAKVRVVTVREAASTQLLAKEYLAHHSDDGPVAFIADKQTAGYGQHGRHYYSPAGTGLYLSLLLSPQKIHQLRKSGLLTTGVAVVLCKVLEQHFPQSHLSVKWVNDVYQNGKKVAGILSEAVYQLGNEEASLIIGIGINLTTQSFPQALTKIAGALTSTARIDRNSLAADLLVALLSMLADYGTGKYLAEYRQRCFILGRSVAIKTGNGILRGTAVDINQSGSLVIADSKGERRTIRSGEVMKVRY